MKNFNNLFVVVIVKVEYCNTTNLDVSVSVTKKSKVENSNLPEIEARSIPAEKIVESDSKLRVKFVPLECNEHVIDIQDNGVSIEGFPIKLNVFPNKDVYILNKNKNGTMVDSVAKLQIFMNDQKDALSVKVTSMCRIYIYINGLIKN